MKKIYRYKFLREGMKSENGDHVWEVGRKYTFKDSLELCKSGFHASKGIYQAFSYVQGEILVKVECSGKHLSDDTKEVWSEMKVTRCWKWQKIDSVLFSIYAARLVLDNYEKEYPNDKRVRQAIEAAENYAKNPIEENMLAAESAA